MQTRNKSVYILATIVLFALCVIIATFLRDWGIVRGFVGDMLVVGLIYSFIQIFVTVKPLTLCICVVLFAYTIELLQFFRVVEVLGLSNNTLARIVIGTTFDVMDLVAYGVGGVLVWGVEGIFKKV